MANRRDVDGFMFMDTLFQSDGWKVCAISYEWLVLVVID